MTPLEMQVEIMARALYHLLKVNEGMCIDLQKVKVVVYRTADDIIQISELDDNIKVEDGHLMMVHPTAMDAELYRIIQEEKEKEREEQDRMGDNQEGPQG